VSDVNGNMRIKKSGGEGGLKPQLVSVGMSLVINTTFPFERIASVYAGSERDQIDRK
jgi:hypothetical protein